MTVIAVNKKASFSYEILEEIECGILLSGPEVKSVRLGHVRLVDSHAGEKNGELYLFNLYIAPYVHARQNNELPTTHPRKLLVHRKEKNRLLGNQKRNGIALIPLKLYFTDRGLLKVLLGLGKGRKLYDKRELLKIRDWNKKKQRLLKTYAFQK